MEYLWKYFLLWPCNYKNKHFQQIYSEIKIREDFWEHKDHSKPLKGSKAVWLPHLWQLLCRRN